MLDAVRGSYILPSSVVEICHNDNNRSTTLILVTHIEQCVWISKNRRSVCIMVCLALGLVFVFVEFIVSFAFIVHTHNTFAKTGLRRFFLWVWNDVPGL